MHYIRLFRPPSLDKKEKLKLVFTITTDLADTFLCPEQPVPITICAHATQHSDQTEVQVRLDDGTMTWRAGLRVLKVDLQLPAQLLHTVRSTSPGDSSPRFRISISASRKPPEPPYLAEIPFDTGGRILTVSVPFPIPGQEPCYTAMREFRTNITGGVAGTLSIEEEMGESLDRHIWDAGVVTTGLILDMCSTDSSTRWRETPLLRRLLRSATSECPLDVIELGCGVGILGIGLATALSARAVQEKENESTDGEAQTPVDSEVGDGVADGLPAPLNIGSILLTDLPDAEELTESNILGFKKAQCDSGFSSPPLEFESLDWEDGKQGVFGPKASARGWDLVIISDCTYNVDMLSALVDTLSALHKYSIGLGKAGPKIMLATKPRHSSETAFFDLMATKGWEILERATQTLPLIGLDDECVEIYLFGKA